MLKAFNYMFKDNMFKHKALAYCFFVFIVNLLSQIGQIYAPVEKNVAAPPIYYILIILSAIAFCIPSGYGIACIKAIREQGENIVLPFINIKHNFILGFKIMIGIILMSLAFGLIYTIFIIISAIILSIIGSKFIFALLVILITISSLLLISIYSPAFCCIFAEKEWITTFFRYIRATKAMSVDLKNYFKYVGLFIVLMIILGIINSFIIYVLGKGIINATIIALLLSIISSYTGFVFVYIAAKSLKTEVIE